MSSLSWKEAFWTFLFPAKCPSCKIEVEKRGQWCTSCETAVLDVRQLPLNADTSLSALWAVSDYRGRVRELLISYKFSPYQREYRFALQGILKAGECQLPFLSEVEFAIPIPLHSSKRKERGFNQSEELFADWLHVRGIKLTDCLERIRPTIAQSTLSTRKERKENVKSAFEYKNQKVDCSKMILLVDDITTTGATLEEAAKTLKKAGYEKIVGLVLASGALLAEERSDLA